jgi:hypothetical protein
LRITNAAGNETSAKFVEDSFVELFHNNVSKFKTESTGIRVEATGAHSGIRGYGTSPGVYLHDTDSTTGWHMSSNGALYFLHDTDGDGVYNSIAGYFDTGRNWNIYSGALKMGASPLTIISSGRVLQNLEAIQLADNKELRIGTGNDLVIDHNGTDSIIKNNEGDLVFKQEHDDKDIIFQADDGSGGVTQYFRLDGSLAKTYFEKNVQFNDSVKIQFGAGADLSLNHNGTHSFIDNNTGSLYISSTNSVQIEDNSGNDMITAAVGGAVTLFHNGSSKLATTSSGINVTGAISSGAITSTGNSRFNGDFQVGDTLQQNAYGALQVNQTSNVDEEGISVLSSGCGISIRIWVD